MQFGLATIQLELWHLQGRLEILDGLFCLDIALDREIEPSRTEHLRIGAIGQIAAQAHGTRLQRAEQATGLNIDALGGIAFLIGVELHQRLPLEPRIGSGKVAKQMAAERDIKGLVSRHAAGIQFEIAHATDIAALSVMQVDLSIAQGQARDVDLQIGAAGSPARSAWLGGSCWRIGAWIGRRHDGRLHRAYGAGRHKG